MYLCINNKKGDFGGNYSGVGQVNNLKFLLPFLLFGCTTLTEEEQYAREDALILAREVYEVREQACNEAGGAMIINAGGQKLRKRITRQDYRSAICVRF